MCGFKFLEASYLLIYLFLNIFLDEFDKFLNIFLKRKIVYEWF